MITLRKEEDESKQAENASSETNKPIDVVWMLKRQSEIQKTVMRDLS